MTLNENWATMWEAFADTHPDEVAVVVGDQPLTWSAFDERSARLATALADRGLGAGDRVALLLFNCTEYVETSYAAFKSRAVPLNVNYRYKAPEIAHVCNDSGSVVLVFHGSLGEQVDRARREGLIPTVTAFVQVDDGEPLLDGAEWYHEILEAATPAARIERSGDDFLMLYTGGTTGNPKGVVWRHVDLFGALGFVSYQAAGLDVPTTVDEVAATAKQLRDAGSAPTMLCGPPLMHGTALFLAISTFLMGGTVVLLGGRRFDPDELWSLVEKWKVTRLSIVGDAFARPLADALIAAAERGEVPDVSSLQRVDSTGATFSAEHKRVFQRFMPQLVLLDMIGASEGGPFGLSMTMPGQEPPDTAIFTAPPNVVTIDPETNEVLPRGSATPGVLAAAGPMPRGYWQDEAKSAETFREIDGVTYTAPGDFALIDDEGTITLLGRGSVSINSGGEKIFPEEVEVAARKHPNVVDANAVGVPDERFGQAVTLVCSVSEPTEAAEIIATVKEHIADYKAPKHVVVVDEVYRAPNGKADYRWAKETALQHLDT